MTNQTANYDPMDGDAEDAAVLARSARGRHIGKLSVMIFVVLFLLVFLSENIFVSVPSGQVGVMYYRFEGGTDTARVLGEGQKIIAPWNTLFLYDVREQETAAAVDVLTKEGLTLTLHVSIRFHPEIETVGLLHQKVGPDYKDKIILPEVEMVLNTIMSGLEMGDAYSAGAGPVQRALNASLEQMSQEYVTIDDVVLRSVSLPSNVREAVEEKIAQKVMAESYVYRLSIARFEADRKAIEAEGSRQANVVLDTSLTPNILRWKGIEASLELAKSPNSKTLIFGKADGLPLIMNPER